MIVVASLIVWRAGLRDNMPRWVAPSSSFNVRVSKFRTGATATSFSWVVRVVWRRLSRFVIGFRRNCMRQRVSSIALDLVFGVVDSITHRYGSCTDNSSLSTHQLVPKVQVKCCFLGIQHFLWFNKIWIDLNFIPVYLMSWMLVLGASGKAWATSDWASNMWMHLCANSTYDSDIFSKFCFSRINFTASFSLKISVTESFE